MGWLKWSGINKTRLVLLLALLFTALGAGVFRTSAILFMAATLCGAPLVGILSARLGARGLHITRHMPHSGMVGDVVRVRFTVSNMGWCPAFLVHSRSLCFEAASDGNPITSPQATQSPRGWRRLFPRRFKRENNNHARERLEAALLPLNGVTAEQISHDGNAHFETLHPADAEQVLPVIWPGAHSNVESYWKLARRGEYFVPGAGAGTFDPIGLFTDFSARSAPQSLIVMPRPLKLHRLELLAGESGIEQPRGSASVADAAEMSGVRPYRPGEGMRRIHWKATARTNVLHVVEWEEETASGVTLMLDVQSSTLRGPKGADTLESSVLAVASVASYALENGQRVALYWWQKNALGVPQLACVEGHHRGALSTVLTALALIEPCDHNDASLPNLLREAAMQEKSAEGLFVFGSDLCDWAKTWQISFSSSARRGLAFDTASFEESASTSLKNSRQSTKNLSTGQVLPSGVKRVRRTDALSVVLEYGR